LSYHFEPQHEQDGVTVDIPLALLNQLTPQPFEWLVPGLLEEKIIALLRSMPKTLRKSFVPVPDVAKDILETIKNPQVSFRENGNFLEASKYSLYQAMITYCHRRLGKPLPPAKEVWRLESLPTHLFMNFNLLDEDNKMLVQGRDLVALQQKWGIHASSKSQQQIAKESYLERDNIIKWDFDDLPLQVSLTMNAMTMQGFPTLIDEGTHVNLRVLDNPIKAKLKLKSGLRRLFLLNLPTQKLIKKMPINQKLCLQYMKVGNCEQLKTEMLMAIVDSIFLVEPLPRNQAEFEQRLAKGKLDLMRVAHDYVTLLVTILDKYNNLNQALNKQHSSLALPEIKAHLKSLIYKGFLNEISFAQLKHFPRYLKAIKIRLERLGQNPQKDAQKAAQIMPLWNIYCQHSSTVLEESSVELSKFRWMLEELRVSLFAQELKTAYPVSVQRLQKVLQSFES
jgi:ATP-dependent helicase HrpA